MKGKHNKTCRCASWVAASLTAALLVYVTGCEGNSSSASGSGDSTITGNVAAFTSGGLSYAPPRADGPMMAVVQGLMELMIPSAEAAVGGVTVEALGSGSQASTDANGNFTLSGVPAGTQDLMLTFGGQSAVITLDVPASTTLVLQDIVVTADNVQVGQILVQESVTTSDGSGPSNDSSVSGTGNDDADEVDEVEHETEDESDDH